MDKKIKKEFEEYEEMYSLTLRRGGKVKESENPEQIGYTGVNGNIYLAIKHPVFEGLSKKKQRLFRCGVFTHELMHQVFTDFRILFRELRTFKNPCEREIFATINNIVEDPAIENFAYRAASPTYLSALKFSIMTIYNQSPRIEESGDALTQYLSGLIQFGDVGPIKGHFTFPEAEETFRKTAPKFFEAINEIDPEKRMEITKFIFEESRPLWQKTVDENTAAMEAFRKAMEKAGKTMKSVPAVQPGGDPDKSSSDGDKNSQKNGMRRQTLDNLNEGSGSNSENNADKKDENNNADKKDENNTSSSKTLDQESKSVEDAAEEAADVLEKAIDKKEKEEEKEKEGSEFVPQDYNGEERGKRLTNKNFVVEDSDPELYSSIVQKHQGRIKQTAHKFRQIFEFDKDEKIRRNSGKVNLVRVNTSTSSRVFDKRYSSQNFSDTSIFLLIDQSGSMSGARINNARETAIALTEVFTKVNIPMYVMGFTADTRGGNLAHDHYIAWNNENKKRRRSLANIQAYANNRDGASIRYATEILNKRNSEHKMLIVISDGQPAANGYGGDFGRADTKKAVEEARKKNIKVLGVAIGSDAEILHDFYKNDFIEVDSIDMMFSDITKKLKKIFKREE